MTSNFVYREHNDADAYGDETLELYEERADAIAHLKSRVETKLGMPWEKAQGWILDRDPLNSCDEDYVSIGDFPDGVQYFIVTEEKVRPASCLV